MAIGPSLSSAGAQQPRQVFNALVPREGPRAIPVQAPLASVGSYTVDLSQAVQNGTMSVLQSVYVDNWTNAAPVSITLNGTGQVIECPAKSQGYFAVAASNPPVLAIASTGGVNVNLLLLNVPVPSGVWSQSNAKAQSYAAGRASQIVTGGTAVTVFNAGDIATSGTITNPPSATESLFIDPVALAGTAASGTTFELAPGASYTFGPNAGAITANAATAGHKFSVVRS